PTPVRHRNGCSASTEISVRLQPKRAFAFAEIHSDGASLVTGTSAGEIWLWRVADRTPLMAIQVRSGPVYAVALSADGRLLAGGSEDGTVRLWETPGGRLLATLQADASGVWSVALSKDGRLLASAARTGPSGCGRR